MILNGVEAFRRQSDASKVAPDIEFYTSPTAWKRRSCPSRCQGTPCRKWSAVRMPALPRLRSLRWYRWELPTWCVAAAVYSGFLLATWNFQALPLWLAAPLVSLLLAWHGSLQHETIHGHPTRYKCVNTAIGVVPLALWLPYALYRESHLRHHAEARGLTLPGRSPASHYLTAEVRTSMGLVNHAVMRFNSALAVLRILGPAITMRRLVTVET